MRDDEPEDGSFTWSGQGGSRAAALHLASGGSDAGPRYVDAGELGRGAMGRVVAVTDARLDRRIARKEARDAAHSAALLREATITARLEHPGIVPVYDVGQDPDGRTWFTMRAAAGRTLADVAAEAPDLAHRMRLVRRLLGAAEAVAFAHSRGVVHRDLKPENVLVGAFGEALVADWGVARHLDEPDPGGLVGTPRWMSPEQARGGHAALGRLEPRRDARLVAERRRAGRGARRGGGPGATRPRPRAAAPGRAAGARRHRPEGHRPRAGPPLRRRRSAGRRSRPLVGGAPRRRVRVLPHGAAAADGAGVAGPAGDDGRRGLPPVWRS